MLSTLLTVFLASAPGAASSALVGPPAPADIVRTAFADAPVTPAAEDAVLPTAPAVPAGASLPGTTLAASLLLALGAVAAFLVAKKRKLVMGHRIHVLENMPLGARRSLVLARIGDEVLLLGSSEAGIAVLSTKPSASLGALAETAPPPAPLTLLDRPSFTFKAPAFVTRTLARLSAATAAAAAAAAAARTAALKPAAIEQKSNVVAPASHVATTAAVAAAAPVAATTPTKSTVRETETAFDEALRSAGEDQELQAKLASMLGATAG